MSNNRGDYNMKRFLLLSLCFLIIFVTSCTIDDEVEMIEESIVDEPEKPAIEKPAPVVEENITEDLTMELKPIKQFSNYVVSPNAVYGINGAGLEEVKPVDIDNTVYPFDSFFMSKGKLYFTIKSFVNDDPAVEETHYFEQTGNDISVIAKSDSPLIPASEHIEYESNDFKIETTPYDIDGVSTPTSRVYQGLPVVGYLKIDGCVLVENGLWFSVAETIKTRLEGVYLWTISGSSPNRVLESGRIY